MAITNLERVGKAMELLRDGLYPFVERELENQFGENALQRAAQFVNDQQTDPRRPLASWDVAVLLKLMWESWGPVFRETLGQAERTLVSELRTVRNQWAHQNPFSTDDAYRALDSAERLLTAIAAPQAAEIQKTKLELLRLRFDEQVRNERRRTSGAAVESQVSATLTPWRDVVSPHPDVASGRYQQAEFAADLWQVHLGEGSDEYRDPEEFFRRTFLTENLTRLVTNAALRLTDKGGDPVVQLQTNFGGGKTHSMLALYHLFSGVDPQRLLGVETLLQDAGLTALPSVKRVVLVGNKISPSNPVTKPDGIVVHTLWGEMAWQLGGAEAYERIRIDDEQATSPGDRLRELFNDYGPALILVDEWVAYARQLHDRSNLAGGNFVTHFSFAQALTESARIARGCLLVISLPASDSNDSPHTQADDAEVGGERGREALTRLRNVIGRVEASWRPASAEESFEIVRRRLFEPIVTQPQFLARDTTARSFSELYRSQPDEFPMECREATYEARIKSAYPIHPELFDRLYTEWSSLPSFQRTRGVLRLMAAVIHCLWEKGDRNPLILPANVPIDESSVQFELTRYLSSNWVPIIEKDVDGPASLPLALDREVANLGRVSASRRVARTIYLGSAPNVGAANHGVDDRRIKLGCVMPGETTATFGDALRRLSSAATYLYEDHGRYWYSTQPTVTKMAEERSEQLRSDPDAVAREVDARLKIDLGEKGDFYGIHRLAQAGPDVTDAQETRLVVLGLEHPFSREAMSAAETASRAILESRGSAPRLYRNSLVFLAVDRTRLQDLDEAVRKFLAWESILADQQVLDLTPHQVRQAETQRTTADSTISARIPEAYQWLLVPTQSKPQDPITWQALRLTGREPLAVRASRKLRGDELLVAGFGPSRLRMELEGIPLWRGDHVSIKQLVEDFASYIYLPRLTQPAVLLKAIQDGIGLLTWSQDTFAYAESYDESAARYRALRSGQLITITRDNLDGLLVRPEAALQQMKSDEDAARAAHTEPAAPGARVTERAGATPGTQPPVVDVPIPQQPICRRFHGSVVLDPMRVGRDAGRVAEEVIAHLTSLLNANVTVTLEIEAELPDGAPENIVRIVTENSRTLKFSDQGFERG